jgi:hypothetical protein
MLGKLGGQWASLGIPIVERMIRFVDLFEAGRNA